MNTPLCPVPNRHALPWHQAMKTFLSWACVDSAYKKWGPWGPLKMIYCKHKASIISRGVVSAKAQRKSAARNNVSVSRADAGRCHGCSPSSKWSAAPDSWDGPHVTVGLPWFTISLWVTTSTNMEISCNLLSSQLVL